MTEHDHDCANCPNDGTCRNLRGPAVLSLNRRTRILPAPPHPLASTALAPRFARAYAAECRRPSIQGEILLRDTTVALVARLKADGLTPERVLVALKAAIARHADVPEQPSLADEHARASTRSVYRRVLEWMLAEYFAEAPQAEPAM